MKLELELPDILFRVAKTPDEIILEARQALAMYWLARGEIAPERAREVAAPPPPLKDFKAALAAMPDVGEDSDFARCPDLPRPGAEWDT